MMTEKTLQRCVSRKTARSSLKCANEPNQDSSSLEEVDEAATGNSKGFGGVTKGTWKHAAQSSILVVVVNFRTVKGSAIQWSPAPAE
jgi:hypothetical protein